MTQFYGQLGQSYGLLQWIREQFEIIVIYGGLESLSCKFVTKLLTQTAVFHFCIFMGIMHDTEVGWGGAGGRRGGWGGDIFRLQPR